MALVAVLGGWQARILDLLFPRRCVGCGSIGLWLCVECRDHVKEGAVSQVLPGKNVPAIVALLDFGQKPVRELIHTLKYNGIREAAANLVELVSQVVSHEEALSYFGDKAILIPVPTSKAKLKSRGYNQTEEIARELGRWLGLEVIAGGIISIKKKQSQVGKGLAERSQLEGRFALGSVALPKDRPLVLVDDVLTTGSTVEACARVLKEAGLTVAGAMVMSHKRG